MPFVQFNDLAVMVSDAEEKAMDARQNCLNSQFYLTSLKLELLQGTMKTFMHDVSSIKMVNFEKPKRRNSILNTEEESDDNAYIRDYIKLDLPRLKNLCHGAGAVESAFQKGKLSAGPMALMTTEFYGADVALEESGIPIGMTTDVEVRKTLNLPVFDMASLSKDPAKMNDNMTRVREYQQLCSQFVEIMDELREQTSLIYNCLYNMDHSWFGSVQESLHKLVGSKNSMDKRMRNLMGQKTYSSEDMELIHNTVSMAQFIQMLIEANVIDRYGNFSNDARRAVSAVQKKMGSEISLPTPAVQQSLVSLEDALKKNDAEYTKYLKYKEEKASKAHAMEEQSRQAEKARQAEEARKAEEIRRAEEAKKAEQARVLEEARKAMEARKAEEKRKAEQEERARLEAERARQEEAARLAEQARQEAEQKRQAEERRKAEEIRSAEEARKAEETKQAEQQRIYEEARKAVEARQEEERRSTEQARAAEEKERQAEEARKEWVAAEQARQAAQAPAQPQFTKAQEPSGSQAAQPQFTKTQEPSGSQAAQPQFTKTQEPSGSQAAQPQFTKTQEPSGSQAAQPQFTKTQEPSGSQAAQPQFTKTQEPSGSQAAQPQFTKTQEPSGSQPIPSDTVQDTEIPPKTERRDKKKLLSNMKSNLRQKKESIKPEKETADKKHRGAKTWRNSDGPDAEDAWRDQQGAVGNTGFSLKDLPEFPRIVLWILAGILLVSGLWKLYMIAVLSAIVLIGAALVASPLVMKYVHQFIKIGVALALVLVSLVMPNQIIPIPHDPGDTIIMAVQKMKDSREKKKSDPVKDLNLNYLGTNMTKEQFEKKYQGYQEDYQGSQGVKPEEAEKFLQDYLYEKKNLYANEGVIELNGNKKEAVEYQVIHVKKPSKKKLTMFIRAEGKNYKVVVTKQKEDKIKLSKKKVK